MMFLAKSPVVAKYDLSSLKVLYCGTDAISRSFKQAVSDRLDIPFVRQAYALAEATIGATMQTDVYARRGSVGGLRPGTFGRVVDKNGRNLGPNEVGELLFGGPTIMKGYMVESKRSARSVETVDADGWLHTGDIGCYDEQGEYFLLNDLREVFVNLRGPLKTNVERRKPEDKGDPIKKIFMQWNDPVLNVNNIRG